MSSDHRPSHKRCAAVTGGRTIACGAHQHVAILPAGAGRLGSVRQGGPRHHAVTVHGHAWRGRGGSRQAPRLHAPLRKAACLCLSVRPSSCSGGLLLASADCHACSCVRRDAVACVLRPRLSRIQTVPAVQNQSVRPSLRPSIDGLRSPSVQCDCRCLLVTVPLPTNDDVDPCILRPGLVAQDVKNL